MLGSAVSVTWDNQCQSHLHVKTSDPDRRVEGDGSEARPRTGVFTVPAPTRGPPERQALLAVTVVTGKHEFVKIHQTTFKMVPQ